MFYIITSITLHRPDTSQDMSTEYNTPTPLQSHRTNTKYNIIPILIQVQFCEESHSPKTPVLKLRASEFQVKKNTKQEKERGLGLMVAAGPRGDVPPHGGGLGGSRP